jgi:hypothetical protein
MKNHRWIQRLAELEQQYFANTDGAALLDAVSLCLTTGTPAPEWVQARFLNAWELLWKSGQAWTLDAAFHIERPQNRRQGRYRKDQLSLYIFLTVLDYKRRNPGPMCTDLFDAVAEELNEAAKSGEDPKLQDLKFSGTIVQEGYYTQLAALSRVTKN